MVKLKINGVPLDMPFQPYPSQLVTMSKLLSCFQTGTSALIESPTGTGKSLAIICAILGYKTFLERNTETTDTPKPIRFFICSRTHSQLNQLVDQLRKTSYRPRIAILGSKSQYCINPKLKNAVDKNMACAELRKFGGCLYFNGKDRLAKRTGDKMYDIEELRAEGKKCVGCPYYASRTHAEDAEIVFLPYNYLIDSKIRQATDILLSGSIVIIDEAHNIEDVCRSAGSLELTSKVVDIVTNELIIATSKSAVLGEVKNDFMSLVEMFKKINKYAEKLNPMTGGDEFDPVESKDGKTRTVKGKCVLEEIIKMGINMCKYKEALKSISSNEDAKDLIGISTLQLLEEIEKVFEMTEMGAESYVLCFQRFKSEPGKYTLNIWLLDPGVVFGPIVKQVKAIALLSGTLTPFASFTSELRHAFPHQIVAPHILRSEQVFVASVRQGHLGRDLCGTYSVADTQEYVDQIAKIIVDVSGKVSHEGGTLVFVPSYAFLTKLSSKIPQAIVEPRSGGGSDFDKCMKVFQASVYSRAPAILLCVYRGKAAEGINFQDSYARAVIAVGIPYPSLKDPQISLKREYNDKGKKYNGRQWYEAQAYRALNQALGRAIRHANDWGAIFLLDSRLAESRTQSSLPMWVTNNVKRFDRYDMCTRELALFVENNAKSKNK
ncbi:hypothetical protein PAEPH01_1598 [Pancytospora epiphaga]|nr:hypothetical protein PAEPH01_1598 [Pancytospora epiphaga]